MKEIPVAHEGWPVVWTPFCFVSFERVGEWGDQVTCKSHLITRPLRFSPLLLSSFESFERLPIVHFHFCEQYSLQHRVFFNVDVRCISFVALPTYWTEQQVFLTDRNHATLSYTFLLSVPAFSVFISLSPSGECGF